MKLELENSKDNKKTTLDENASIYQARDERTPEEKLKAFKGKEKIQYFFNYFFWKIALAIAGVVVVGLLVYTIFFKVRPDTVCGLYVINTPFGPNAYQQMQTELGELLVTDDVHEQIILDDQYYFWTDDYNYRMAFVTRVAAGEVDMLILDRSEFKQQVNNGILLPVDKCISPELYAKLEEYYVTAVPKTSDSYGNVTEKEEAVYGLNIAPFITRINSEYGKSEDYCVAFVANSDHKENFEKVVKYIFAIED
ncbi:MAG: hypothetical protein MJ131_02625 [Lachnospiraceae bacterium]|nr:hypothetical protein [Lachnospiraceae bacterium]